MRALAFAAALLPTITSCSGILGIPSESSALCEDQCVVTVSGNVIPVDSTTAAPKPNVRIALTSLPAAELVRVTSNASGAYTLPDLDVNTALELEMSFEQTNPTVPSGVLVTRFLAGNASQTMTLDVPVVDYHWLAKVAFECGIFPSLAEATYQDVQNSTGVNFYYISRSTVIVEVQNEDGTPAPVNRSDIVVSVDGYMNSHETPDDTEFLPRAHVCFLEPDSTGVFKGVDTDRGTSGRFVVFRVRDAGGTGAGFARVLLPGFPPGAVNLRSSGSVGYVRIRQGEGPEPLPSRPITFEQDIYPLFTELTCVACHRPGGPGYEMGMIRGGFRADFSGTVDQVFEVLTAPPSEGCDTGAVQARVCTAKPEASLLYTKPRLETGSEPSDHKGIAFPEDTLALKLILEWIRNGAPLR